MQNSNWQHVWQTRGFWWILFHGWLYSAPICGIIKAWCYCNLQNISGLKVASRLEECKDVWNVSNTAINYYLTLSTLSTKSGQSTSSLHICPQWTSCMILLITDTQMEKLIQLVNNYIYCDCSFHRHRSRVGTFPHFIRKSIKCEIKIWQSAT